MASFGLVSCASRKRESASPAKDLYDSPLFKKARLYVEQRCDVWCILSAKYGVVEPNKRIKPYEQTLNRKTREERKTWARKCWLQLRRHLKPADEVVVIAGAHYREYLVPLILEHGCSVDVPLAGKSIGIQLQWLKRRSKQSTRESDLNRFYAAIQKLKRGLGGMRTLSDCRGQQNWPKSGVYFFFEEGELRFHSQEQRIVRVGTHGVSLGSKSTLWGRVRAHRGTRAGKGNHRGSIFRLHVGNAIASKSEVRATPTWGIGQSADAATRTQEERRERAVSKFIGAMRLLWIAVDDVAGPSSDRAYLERNIVGLLVGPTGPVDPPSRNWPGRNSPDERIRNSGLWNLNYLGCKYSREFLDVFDEYIEITLGKRPPSTKSLAPSNWRLNE